MQEGKYLSFYVFLKNSKKKKSSASSLPWLFARPLSFTSILLLKFNINTIFIF